MNKYQRHEAIIRWVNEQGTVRVSEIVSRYNVSDMTVRRDLEELDDQGLLKKIHGGLVVIVRFNIRKSRMKINLIRIRTRNDI